jgi:ankyrin repeat protein
MSDELFNYAASGDLERIELLVKGGANIDETGDDGLTALIWASLRDRLDVVVYLVEHGANVAHTDENGMTALHWASLYGNMLTVN